MTAASVVSVTGKEGFHRELRSTQDHHFNSLPETQNLKDAHELDGKTPYRVTHDALEESQFGSGANGGSWLELDTQTPFRSTKNSPKSSDFLSGWSSF
jgi:hypothetical protein